ncbi:MAG: processive 1,2-diacylglycerol beta-glucosyltransferase [Solirubrobacteraceae bacterium]|jgi:UDP-N-acetylglucosamine:LPS N-acetylglucosamine transferase|nr:processive 1,2-diacylglycerol beta-glucosyltransferase [Solirubrobacteraceae bacterium]
MADHVLIFSASIGAGHDMPAAVLEGELRARGATAEVVDSLDVMGPVIKQIVAGASSLDTKAGSLVFEAGYVIGVRFEFVRRRLSSLVELLARRRMRAFLASHPAAVIVSTYPITTELLGRMRLRGWLTTPTVAAITDLAALKGWAHRGIDLHLAIHPESEPEIRAIAGPGGPVEAVHGFSDLGFTRPPERATARRELGLPADGRIVVVSGGGWGVGDLQGATDAALNAGAATVVALIGHNEDAKQRLEAAYAGDERVQVWGFTDRMVALLAAADILVHATAGLTVLEAMMCGCRVISYGWAYGHIRTNNRAYERLGMVTVARNRAALDRALDAAVAAPPLPPDVPQLPNAADLVLSLARADRQPANAG